MNIQFHHHYFNKEFPFPNCLALLKTHCHFKYVSKCRLHILIHSSIFLFMPILHSFNFCKFLVKFNIRELQVLQLFSQDCFWHLRSLHFHVQFRLNFSTFMYQIAYWNFSVLLMKLCVILVNYLTCKHVSIFLIGFMIFLSLKDFSNYIIYIFSDSLSPWQSLSLLHIFLCLKLLVILLY